MPKGTRPQTDEQRFQGRLTTERARAKSLLKGVREEMSGIPDMPSTKGVKMGEDSLIKGLTSLGVVINDGLRKLGGKDTSKELKARSAALRGYLRKTQRLKESLSPGPNSLTSARDASDVPRLPKR